MAASAIASCGPDGPGRLALVDAGPRDAQVGPGDGSIAFGRPDGGPTLPGADRIVVLTMGAPEVALHYSVEASPAMLDVHIAVDTTGSFVEEIDAIESSLAHDVIPSIRSFVDGSSFGLSTFQDFPAAPYGGSDDRPFQLLQRVTSDANAIGRAVVQLDDRIGNGGDIPESGFESIFQVARGTGYSGGNVVIPRFSGGAAIGGGVSGGVGFRDGSFRVLVHATDALSHDDFEYEASFHGTHGRSEALAALIDAHIYFVGITNGGPPRAELTELAIATGATIAPTGGACPTGVGGSPNTPIDGVCPLVFDVLPDGTGLSSALVSGVTGLVSTIDFDRVVGTVEDNRLGFVRAIRATTSDPPPSVPAPTTEDSTPGDGVDDSFASVRAGTRLEFDILLRNVGFASQSYEQTYRVRIRIAADGSTLADEWIRIVVPATPG